MGTGAPSLRAIRATSSSLGGGGISCPGPVAVRMDTPVARYRCSTTGIILGAFALQRPIIPWPAYEDGESADLAGVIQAAAANAEH